ncbi:hypothetical protein L226DRAFT_165779 [Lentinus tigrinus ALCF2SS1-7]|uniref:TM7S3/TM198-like domain-containing protein n=1 Tax=Lentinus tigrinus ALCF2SS1-6 TaxID=1328759 RepID=A0A5C2S2M2_9APHY|nr:hypothetical protein L227DRAFT_506198 [Lentinus tigrinus ALCF2SS1-6]RPD71947.1 hypothetical protein L226DRAFT_165779 [Lentinus tigrinus ALCF2SS1-7]
MAESFRQNSLTPHVLTILSWLLLLLAFVSDTHASPIARTDVAPDLAAHYWKRVTPVVVTSETGDNTSVINPTNNQPIAQGPGTDGGGTDFSLPAIIWLAFVFVTGIPLALAGVRLYRVTTGLGIGLALTLCVWAAFVNTVSADGLSDIVLTVIGMGGFLVGFICGVLDFGRWAGILLIGFLGGLSVGIRVVLLRPGLLIPTYIVNWLVLVPFMLIGIFSVLLKQRLGIISCCAAIGSFLVALGVDLILEKQSGWSFALRFMFDRNNSHFLAIVHKGYDPSLMTQIILGASIGAIPILAFAQHKIFKGPFRRKPTDTEFETASFVGSDSEDPSMGSMTELKKPPPPPPPRMSRMQLLKSRFSLS